MVSSASNLLGVAGDWPHRASHAFLADGTTSQLSALATRTPATTPNVPGAPIVLVRALPKSPPRNSPKQAINRWSRVLTALMTNSFGSQTSSTHTVVRTIAVPNWELRRCGEVVSRVCSNIERPSHLCYNSLKSKRGTSEGESC